MRLPIRPAGQDPSASRNFHHTSARLFAKASWPFFVLSIDWVEPLEGFFQPQCDTAAISLLSRGAAKAA